MQYGQRLGGYYSPEQLCDSALADLHLDTLVRCFVANPEDVTCIPVNHSSPDRLTRHPYLRYEQARAIYELRRREVHLADISQLESLPEIDKITFDRIKFYLCFDN